MNEITDKNNNTKTVLIVILIARVRVQGALQCNIYWCACVIILFLISN